MTPYLHPAALPVEALLAQCELRRQRRSGPGGQHRNKVETGIVLVHLPSGVRAEATERRSQAMNQKMAIQRLRTKLALQLRCPRDPTALEPSLLWQLRAQGGRIAISAEHDDFPALLAEALDVLAASNFEGPASSAFLGLSPSQLVKFLKREPQALQWVNVQRRAHNLRPLH